MPSFDVVSQIDMHEVTNALDQANREVSTRFDFKGSGARFDRAEEEITMYGNSEFQLKQMLDILYTKMTQRKVDLKAMHADEPEESGKGARQVVHIKQGVDSETAKKIVKLIKDKKMKIQAAIQGEQVRVTGKKRDHLQEVIAMLKESDINIPLQYVNYRD